MVPPYKICRFATAKAECMVAQMLTFSASMEVRNNNVDHFIISLGSRTS